MPQHNVPCLPRHNGLTFACVTVCTTKNVGPKNEGTTGSACSDKTVLPWEEKGRPEKKKTPGTL